MIALPPATLAPAAPAKAQDDPSTDEPVPPEGANQNAVGEDAAPAPETGTSGAAQPEQESASLAPASAVPSAPPSETAATTGEPEAPADPRPSLTAAVETEPVADAQIPVTPSGGAAQDAGAAAGAAPPATPPAAGARPGKIVTAYDFLPPWPGTDETGTDAANAGETAQPTPALTHDAPGDADLLSIGRTVAAPLKGDNGIAETETDPCLAYREFLARNAEGELGAADLNASMLAEIRGGGGCQ